jgi:hypothetical protein
MAAASARRSATTAMFGGTIAKRWPTSAVRRFARIPV